MNIIDVTHPTLRRPTPGCGHADRVRYAASDLDAQQKYREVLLREAESVVTRATSAGCVSEISIVANILDLVEYQEYIRETLNSLANSSVDFYALQRPRPNDLKVECYDDSHCRKPSTFEAVLETQSVDDNDIETFGYMGWLAR